LAVWGKIFWHKGCRKAQKVINSQAAVSFSAKCGKDRGKVREGPSVKIEEIVKWLEYTHTTTVSLL
jgi:Zn finger protein HypA/HybF involved in hydrogenase expression